MVQLIRLHAIADERILPSLPNRMNVENLSQEGPLYNLEDIRHSRHEAYRCLMSIHIAVLAVLPLDSV